MDKIFIRGGDLLSKESSVKLIIIGGAEDKTGEMKILKEVCKAYDNKGNFTIATIATKTPKSVAEKYIEIFNKIGIEKITILNIENREEANNIKNVEIIKSSSLIFFTGGDQLRITSILGGTKVFNEIIEAAERKCVFIGTSAGASVMSDTMIVAGLDDQSPKKCTLKMAPGIGLIKGVLVDQHFAQRGRIGRILVGIAENPQSLGIGIDEDTSIIVNHENRFKVIGSGAVYVIDGDSISYSNVSEQNADELLSIYDVKMHVLKEGNEYDIKKRRPIREDTTEK